MHLEKNVFESTIGILLDIKKKMKDGLKSQTDLVNLGINLEKNVLLDNPMAQFYVDSMFAST